VTLTNTKSKGYNTMATRGTYKLDGLSHIMYNHWDNYPSGTANHLLEVAKNHHSFTWEHIVRGISGMYSTDSIYDGPAEFHYEISMNYIKCYSITSDDTLKLHSEGKIHEWINAQIKDALEETDNADEYTLIQRNNSFYYTIAQIQEEVETCITNALSSENKGWTGNASSYWQDALRLINMIPPYKKGEMVKSEWKNRIAKFYADKYKHENSDYFLSYLNS